MKTRSSAVYKGINNYIYLYIADQLLTTYSTAAINYNAIIGSKVNSAMKSFTLSLFECIFIHLGVSSNIISKDIILKKLLKNSLRFYLIKFYRVKY